ncbi:aminoglycoside 6-adenylyltransferase [Mycolicibacterium sp. S3B2]|uniref:aminoglycoside 6-adenylyltransferase n=1 Tax=Mycolicibacterium sp. S3B2 TaxID=3415120 RepID=UPI003C7DE2A4
MDYNAVLDALSKWAQRTDNVRAVLVTGSAAAGDVHPLSDRDIEIYAHNVESLLEDESWWNGFGEVLVVERLANDPGPPTRLIYYAGGKLDFTLIPAGDLATAVHTRPFQVLVDKDACAPPSPSTVETPNPPKPDEVDQAINWGYAAALMCAKAVVRDELWSAKLRDNDLKDELLRMIEWDHRLRYGASIDTRYLATRMNTWMDADIRSELSHCWSRFDAADTAAALRRTTALFSRLSERVATALDLPVFDHERLISEIDHILQKRQDQHPGPTTAAAHHGTNVAEQRP